VCALLTDTGLWC